MYKIPWDSRYRVGRDIVFAKVATGRWALALVQKLDGNLHYIHRVLNDDRSSGSDTLSLADEEPFSDYQRGIFVYTLTDEEFAQLMDGEVRVSLPAVTTTVDELFLIANKKV